MLAFHSGTMNSRIEWHACVQNASELVTATTVSNVIQDATPTANIKNPPKGIPSNQRRLGRLHKDLPLRVVLGPWVAFSSSMLGNCER